MCSSGALRRADPVHQDLEQGRLTRTVLAHDANPSKYKINLYFRQDADLTPRAQW